MEFIFSKKQIEQLREGVIDQGLKVAVDAAKGVGAIANTLKDVSKLGGSENFDKIEIGNSNKQMQSTPSNGQPDIKAEIETDKPQNITASTIEKLTGAALNNSQISGAEIDLKNSNQTNESVIRYSKKELNEILFK